MKVGSERERELSWDSLKPEHERKSRRQETASDTGSHSQTRRPVYSAGLTAEPPGTASPLYLCLPLRSYEASVFLQDVWLSIMCETTTQRGS